MASREQLLSAIRDLDPESRALIELSAHRGMTDGEVGEVMGVPAADVRSRRERAMADLAGAMGKSANGDLQEELERLDEKDWAPPVQRATRGRRTSPRFLAAAGAVVVVIAVVAAVLIASERNEGRHKRAAAPAEPQNPGGPGPVVTLKRLHQTHGRGSVQLLGGARLRLRARDFLAPQPGGYAVWLYRSPSRTRLLAYTTSKSIRRDLTLPGDWRRYRFVDVSRQVTRGSPYSGLTLLRAPLKDLKAG